MNAAKLELFTDPHILRQVGRPLLTQFFGHFNHVLPHKHFLPNPRPDNEAYFDSLAAVLGRTYEVPDALRHALFEIETLATSEKVAANDTDNGSDATPLSQAIQSWLHLQHINPNIPQSSNPTLQQSIPRPPADLRPLISDLQSCSSRLPSPLSSLPSPDSDSATFARLARLSITEYDRIRRAEAKRLHLRLATLDAEVARCRSEINDDAQANAVQFPMIEPWPAPILDASELMNQVAARYTHYIILQPGAADALALFTTHTHAFTAFYQTPRLNLYSPKRGCGKTTTLDVIATMVPRPFRTENMRAPVLFRVVDQQQPTLLLDEVDTYLHQADELRGLLNAGHKRGACAYRCEGGGNAVRAFKAFAPAVLAGIGELPATLHDRSILIPLIPAERGQARARFDEHRTGLEKTLARKLARWANDNFDALAACDPPLPDIAFNRLADNWRPIFAVAHIVGGDWPQRAIDSFTKLTGSLSNHQPSATNPQLLHGGTQQPATSDSQLLLTAIRDIFAQAGVSRMFSKDLVASLQALSTLDIRHAAFLSALTATRLGRQLRSLNIRPQTLRIGNQRAKGYTLADLTPAFTRFLGPT